MSAVTIPDSVKTRKRYSTLADLSSCLIILSLPLQFWDSFTSSWWPASERCSPRC